MPDFQQRRSVTAAHSAIDRPGIDLPAIDAQGADASAAEAGCYHCGLPLPAGGHFATRILGAERAMCCAGCEAVAAAIVAAGQEDFYRHRTDVAAGAAELVPDFLRQAEVYDNPGMQRSFVSDAGEGHREASLLLEGITCAACAWLIERHLGQQPGVISANVNYSSHRARVIWQPQAIRLSEILTAIHAIGYRAQPYDAGRSRALLDAERRRSLIRIGVSGVFGMQVMMLAAGLYLGDWSGMEAGYRALFNWISLGLTLPIIGYSAQPFFRAAARDLRSRQVGMDVPVSLGIGGAFAASLWATVSGQGTVYYDSVAMFVLFLLTARHFELAARRRAGEAADRLVQLLPATARRLDGDGGEQLVPVTELQLGDRLRVRPGEPIPADGEVLEGRSSVDEALLSGESLPVTRGPGDTVVGGSLNVESPLLLVVRGVGEDSVVSQMLRLLDRAQAEKPAITRIANRVAGHFVLAVLLLALGVGGYWYFVAAAADWLPIMVSVLVVTCPCALSLATPTAITAASGALAREGLLITRGAALETLARTDHVCFDKTGTLTDGKLAVQRVVPLAGTDLRDGGDAVEGRASALALAAALEAHSEHPIARALCAAAGEARGGFAASEVENTPGSGLSGSIDGRRYHIGSAAFVAAQGVAAPAAERLDALRAEGATLVLLADEQHALAAFLLADQLRSGGAELVAALRRSGCRVSLLSGDHAAAAQRVAAAVGIDDVHAGLAPADKLARLRELQAGGAVVAMVGDGINDAAVLAGADVSVAMGSGADIAAASADLLLTTDHLDALAAGFAGARRTLWIVRQNIAWAIAYNLLALPAAAAGLVAPWMAAIGMSLSSLLVVANASRLRRTGG